MKLRKLTLNNFRAFYGEQVLDLSTEDAKPAVLIFGNNGAGKTTLLNAFTWALYGTFSDDVEQQHRVIHDQAWADAGFGEPISASVHLGFEHEGTHFTITRDVTVTKKGDEQTPVTPQLTVFQTMPDGETKGVPNGQDRIEKILPEGLRRFFFFNGERMEKMFTGEENNDEVKRAIKTLLNLESIERAINKHLPAASKQLAREIDKKSDSRLSELTDTIERLEQQQATVDAAARKLSKDASSYQREVEEAERALRANSQAAPLQVQRSRLTRQIQAEHDKLAELKARKRERLSKSGFIAFTVGTDETVMKLAEGMRQRRELPAGIQRSFIDGLLEDGQCMCGRPLEPHTPPYQELEQRRYNAGLADVEARWVYVDGQMRNLRDERAALLSDLKQNAQDILTVNEAINHLNAERSDVDRQLEGVNIQDVQRLEQRRKEYVEKKTRALIEHQQRRDEFADLEKQIDATKRLFKHAEGANEKSRRVQRQVNLVEEVAKAFHEVLALKTEEVREELDRKIKDVFSRIFIKSYIPEIDDSFELHLKSPAGVAIRSTGENQILGLSFVGAVSEVAKNLRDRRTGTDDALAGGGGIYPVVMDAPFGSLDLTYQEEISRALPELTSQIVTLLSQSQARGKVMENLQASASSMYVLRSITPNKQAQEETIEINHRAVPYVSHGDFEHTVLEKVTV
ncbi:AAA family ATPase [Streptomyces sp. RLB3-6]|uniref:AAA family ATPase n=1 Tax=Streptomyces sp. RLB3-6 TaxID=2594457 RepID=UPI00116376C1|nr:AAA family ATPase [Streptomyces sp. RLB3-6]QDN93543.1 AAA family ATPase [Streptomyces sp. RLB3-6]